MGEGRRRNLNPQAQPDESGSLVFWRVGCVFGIVAVILATACFVSYRQNRRMQAFAERAAGTVIELRHTGGDSTYSPVVRFRTLEGQAVTFVTSWGTNPPAYKVGDPVTVIYDAAAPAQARIDSFFSFWSGTLVLALMAAVFGLLCAILMVVAKRR